MPFFIPIKIQFINLASIQYHLTLSPPWPLKKKCKLYESLFNYAMDITFNLRLKIRCYAWNSILFNFWVPRFNANNISKMKQLDHFVHFHDFLSRFLWLRVQMLVFGSSVNWWNLESFSFIIGITSSYKGQKKSSHSPTYLKYFIYYSND